MTSDHAKKKTQKEFDQMRISQTQFKRNRNFVPPLFPSHPSPQEMADMYV